MRSEGKHVTRAAGIRRWLSILVLLPGVSAGGAEQGIVDREPMVVRSTTMPLLSMAGGAFTIGSQLRYVPGIDLQEQGVAAGQSDLSIQGSSFSGAGLSIEGLALPNAQTEHFHTALPFPPGLFGAPRVLTGTDQALGSSGFLVGTVDYAIVPVETRRRMEAGISSHDSSWANILVQQAIAGEAGVAGVGAFAGAREIRQVDFPDNHVESQRVGAQLQFRQPDGAQTDLLLARQEKTFGVRGYYGVNPDWAGEEETGDTLLFLAHEKQDADTRVRVAAFYREFQDEYRLFWELPGIFENDHRLDTLGGSLDGTLGIGEHGLLDWRLTGLEEKIRSTALGRYSRTHVSARVVPGYRQGRWRYQAGGSMEIFEDDTDVFLPLAVLSYELQADMSVQASYSETVRQPSYTELNFESPASLGNRGLEKQRARTAHLRVEGALRSDVVIRVGVFYRQSRDTVDWIRRTPESTRWEAENIGSVDTRGVEAVLRWVPMDRAYLEAQYTGLDQTTDANVYASRYALDTPRHLLCLTGHLQAGNYIALDVSQRLRQQARNPLRERSRQAYPASLQVTCQVWQVPDVSVYAMVDNLWDDDYQVLPGQAQYAGRRYYAGLACDW